jgi:hypothetical protein
MMLEAIDVVAKGGMPRGSDPKTYASVRPYDGTVNAGEDWKTKFEKELVARW